MEIVSLFIKTDWPYLKLNLILREYIYSPSLPLPEIKIKRYITNSLLVSRKYWLTSASNYLYYLVMRVIINVIVVSFVLS